jgi:hypothetical protein
MMVGEISFTNLIKVTNTMIAGHGSTVLVPTTGHGSPHSHLIKHQTDSDNKVQRYKGDISGGPKKRSFILKSRKRWEDDHASNYIGDGRSRDTSISTYISRDVYGQTGENYVKHH